MRAVGCPDERTIERFVAGELDAGTLDTLDEHLDGCERCRTLVRALLGGAGPRTTSPRAELPTGARVGRYEIEGVLGRGAMGIVYAAHDPRLARRVALKLLDDAGDERSNEERLAEARAMARLAHPNVVRVYDVEVEAEGGRTVIAMERIEGKSLRELAREPLPLARRLALLRDAGRGLAAAHRAGLVHRDFKPDNVLVGDDGIARVTDFGLARPGEASPSPDAELERTATLAGTPAYMAPEQLSGLRPDARADQFAFAVTARELLEGARPFRGDDVRGLREAIARGAPPWQRRDVPARARAALDRALAAEPRARHPSLEPLLAALDPPAPTPRAALALGAVAVVLALGVGARWALARGPCESLAPAPVIGDAEAEALTARLEREAPSYGRESATHALAALRAFSSSWAASDRAVCEATYVAHAAPEPLHDARARCLVRARRTFDEIVLGLGEAPPEAIDGVADALPDLSVCETLDADDAARAPPVGARAEIEAAETQIDDARALLALGRVAEARSAADALAPRVAALHHAPLEAELALVRGRALLAVSALDEADTTTTDGVVHGEEAGDDRALVELWTLSASIAGARRAWDDGLERARHGRAVLSRLGDAPSLAAPLALVTGVLATELERWDEAERELADARRLSEAAFGPRSPRTAAVETELGHLARARGQLDEALAHHRAALDVDRDALGASHPTLGRLHHNLGGVLRRMHRLDEARAEYEEALRIRTAALGPRHADVGRTENSLGLVSEDAGDLDGARDHFERALALLGEQPEEPIVRTNLADVELRSGHAERARALLAPALETLARSDDGDERSRALLVQAELERPDDLDAARRAAHEAVLAARSESARARASERASWLDALAMPSPPSPTRAARGPRPPPPEPAPAPAEPVRADPPPEPPPIEGSYLPGRAWGGQ